PVVYVSSRAWFCFWSFAVLEVRFSAEASRSKNLLILSLSNDLPLPSTLSKVFVLGAPIKAQDATKGDFMFFP
ncbi:MAG: hypothetical protein AAGA28_14895, partial [Pseudomonadota bacterium]